jgi:hypothetical protein
MASLTFPVKVWVLPAATPGTTANPAHSTTVAIQTCNIRKRDINPPPVFRSCDWGEAYPTGPFLIYGSKKGEA